MRYLIGIEPGDAKTAFTLVRSSWTLYSTYESLLSGAALFPLYGLGDNPCLFNACSV